MPIPKLTSQQLASARAAATQARRTRAEFKNEVKHGKISIIQALSNANHDEILGQLRVVDLLKCVPRIGEKRALQLMDRLEIAPNRRIRGLGRLQIAALTKEFGDR